MRLAGKVAIITGSGRGIGRACAVLFAAEGASVVVADIDQERSTQTVAMVEDAGGRAVAVTVDVTRADDVRAMVERAVSNYGGLDILVNNAARLRPGTVVDLSEDDWDAVVATSLTAAYLTTRSAIPAMTDGGSIINMGSVSGLMAERSNVAYASAKAGLAALTRCLAADHASAGIRANCICPGVIDTPPVARIFSDPAVRDGVERAHLLGRLGRPEEIAALALFLASDESSFITGATIVADGGISVRSPLSLGGAARPAKVSP